MKTRRIAMKTSRLAIAAIAIASLPTVSALAQNSPAKPGSIASASTDAKKVRITYET